MRKMSFILSFLTMLFIMSCGEVVKKPAVLPADMNPSNEAVSDHKIVVYQLMTRLFGNTKTLNKKWGSKEENGVGKFSDITDKALKSLKDLNITHVWYTGVLAHAVCADYTKYGIALDDADVIKGRAGSPYAIKDYYDVNPDLANNVRKRMGEFKALIKRTHKQGMKVVIDLVANHVARGYNSQAKPRGVKGLGQGDDKSKAFSPKNNFYYIPGQDLQVPSGNGTPGPGNTFSTKDGKFKESPAKVTGNDKFTATPNVNDWFETVKINYGVDIKNGRKKSFSPIPSTWKKMRDIMVFWAKMGVDGFRCDMAEMVPVEFWEWSIPQVKKINKKFIYIAEIYNKNAYREYLFKGGFDYLYDKVGLYDSLKPLMSGGGDANDVYWGWRGHNSFGKAKGYTSYLLRFLENHDEQRIASTSFAGNPWAAVPAMTVSATLASGPVMIYFGQEVGEPGKGVEGFGGEDGRTTIFDYWGVPEHQKWVNNGKYDGGGLDASAKKLRNFYKKLFGVCLNSEAIRKGKLYDLQFANKLNLSTNYNDKKIYSYLRYSKNQVVLVVVNFDLNKSYDTFVKIPVRGLKLAGLNPRDRFQAKDLLGDAASVSFNGLGIISRDKSSAGIPVKLKPMSAAVYEIKKIGSMTLTK